MMRIHFVVTDDSGTVFEGDANLTTKSGSHKSGHSRPPSKRNAKAPTNADLDFDLPPRAFVKRYARGLSGPKRLTLLVARLSEGKVGTSVLAKEIEKQWNSMTEPMGGRYNAAYQTRAKDEGWIDVPSRGSVVLRKDWKDALKGNGR